jgi:hypothetical protein
MRLPTGPRSRETAPRYHYAFVFKPKFCYRPGPFTGWPPLQCPGVAGADGLCAKHRREADSAELVTRLSLPR